MPERNDNRELLDVLGRVERMFHNLEAAVGRLREAVERSVTGLESSITHLVRTIEQDDHLRERAEKAEQRERDERHDQLLELIRNDLTPRIENVAKSLRNLPAGVLGELRAARWETSSTGFPLEPLPPLLPPHREPTGKIAVARPDVREDTTGVFDLEHTDGEKRATKEFVGGIALFLWHKGGKWAAAVGGGAGAWHFILKLLGH